jgi:polyvinyl alcohol dehydrogenase (cytochrome)
MRVPRTQRSKLLTAAAACAAAFAVAMASSSAGAAGLPAQSDWASSGQNNHNTRNAALEHSINASNVGSLEPKWVFTTAGDVSATATVVNGVVYVPDWGGKLWAIDAKSGKAIWSHDVSDYTGTPGTTSRTSPAYWNGELVIGTGNLMTSDLGGAFEVGVDARTGAMLWRTQSDPDSATIMTGSPTIDNGIVYTGVSSKAEHTTVTPTFRGSVEALDARTGKILWKTYMAPEGFNGAAVWGSQPVVDLKTGMLYVTTGNSYSVPEGYCANPGQTNCAALPSDDYIDSVVALDLKTGKVAWAHHTLTADTWTMANPNASPDFDFGADPNLYTVTMDGKETDLLGVGQKNGMYYAFDPTTGKLIWTTQAGPGGVLGGIEWGTSTDGERIYAAITMAATRRTRTPPLTDSRRPRRGAYGRRSTRRPARSSGRPARRRTPSTSRTASSRAPMGWSMRAPQAVISTPWTQGPVKSSGASRAAEPCGRGRRSSTASSTGAAAMTPRRAK